MKKLSILAVLAVAASSQAAILIDDFSSGAFGMSITSGSWVGSQAGTMLGGERDASLLVNSNPLNQSINVAVNGRVMAASSDVQVTGQFGLDYDGPGDESNNVLPFEPGLPGLGNLNLAAGNTGFRFHFLSNDLPMVMTINTFTYTVGMKTAVVNVGGGLTSPFTVDVLFSSFTGAGNFNDVDRIRVFFDTSMSGDFALDKIEVVPEPASMAALGLGLAAIVARRRRR